MAVMTELVALEQERRAKRPAELQAVMDQATDDLAASGMAGGFFQAGHVAPDFVLQALVQTEVAYFLCGTETGRAWFGGRGPPGVTGM